MAERFNKELLVKLATSVLEKKSQQEALLNFANLINGASTATDAATGSQSNPNASKGRIGMTALNMGNAYRRLKAVQAGALPAGGASISAAASTPLAAAGVAAQALTAAQAGWALGKLVNKAPAGRDEDGKALTVQDRMEALGDRVGTGIGNFLYRR